MTEQHHIEIRKGLQNLGYQGTKAVVVAVCKTCGWEGQPQTTERAAETDGDGHVIAVCS